MLAWNLTPKLTPCASLKSITSGVTLVPQIEHGQVTLTVSPCAGASRLPLSSTARALIVVVGYPWAIHESLPVTEVSAADIVVAGCQVVPPSVDASAPARTPPPASVAVPLIVAAVPSGKVAP